MYLHSCVKSDVQTGIRYIQYSGFHGYWILIAEKTNFLLKLSPSKIKYVPLPLRVRFEFICVKRSLDSSHYVYVYIVEVLYEVILKKNYNGSNAVYW